jgi:hypothetical protein
MTLPADEMRLAAGASFVFSLKSALSLTTRYGERASKSPVCRERPQGLPLHKPAVDGEARAPSVTDFTAPPSIKAVEALRDLGTRTNLLKYAEWFATPAKGGEDLLSDAMLVVCDRCHRAAVGALAERRAIVAWFGGKEEPIEPDRWAPPKEPTPRERAEKIRDEAAQACADRFWGQCATKLDDAKALDPTGEAEPRAQGLRTSIREGTTPKPGPREKP